MGNCLKSQYAASWVDDDEWAVEEEKMAVEKMERVEVKIRITGKQLQELLEKVGRDGKGRSEEKVLADVMIAGKVCCQHDRQGHWRPSLQSIPEVEES